MTEQSAGRFTATRTIFWGYFFLLLDLNINFFGWSVPLLADSIGWLLAWRGIRRLILLRPSLKLLFPFCMVLGIANLTQVIPDLESVLPGWLSPLVMVMSLYTHFQLLTDLAALAEGDFQRPYFAAKLRSARTVLVVTRTVLACSDLLLNLSWLAAILALVSLCAGLYALVQLWKLSKSLKPETV